MKLWAAKVIFLFGLGIVLTFLGGYGCASGPPSDLRPPPSPLLLNPTLGGAAPRLVYAGGNSQASVVLPPVTNIAWHWYYVPNPGDEDRPVAFNFWESPDPGLPMDQWTLVGTTTNHTFITKSANWSDFYRASAFFTDLTNQ